MRSATPKVLHTLGGRSMLGHALAAAAALEPERLAVVVRHERDRVAQHALEIAPTVLIADQDDVPGTGRAVQCALDVLGEVDGPVVVQAGDIPLLDGATLAELLAAHTADGNAVTVLTTQVADPTGYGRIVREPGTGTVERIVEHKDASPAEREITEINSSVYVFDGAVLRAALGRLGRLGRDNAQGEVYLTDVLAIARADGGSVRAVQVDDPVLVEGVNDRAQLAVLRAELNRRVLADWMVAGVTVVDPATTWVDVDVELEPDVTLLPGTQLQGSTRVERDAVVGPDTTLTDVHVQAGAQVVRSHGSGAVVGAGAVVGPFSFLRPGTVLGADGKIGAFVETKNAQIGAHAKVPHLSYVGDATIGEHSNIGAGTIFANYDGVNKHRATIGSHVRVGSNNSLVAPLTIGDGAYTGAGSVIRDDVAPGALGLNVAPQRSLEEWVPRRRPDSPGAQAARAALEHRDDGTTTHEDPSSEPTTTEGHRPR